MTRKLLSINLGNFGSTGKIMRFISHIAEENGFETYQAYPENKNNVEKNARDITICSYYYSRVNERLAYYSGLRGIQSFFPTLIFLKKIRAIDPDIVHLHNIHGNFINLPLLFGYLKKHGIKVVWTLHDCWSFTGQCPYFDYIHCEKWKTGCHDCEQLSRYPAAKIDHTRLKWKLKRKWFTGIDNLFIVTPSDWLMHLVKQSYLRDYPVTVINNGIDTEVFKPTKSKLREKYKLDDAFVILGVAYDWEPRKGLNVFIKAAKVLPDDCRIILIGTNDNVDRQLPDNII
ncbi:glycosyltransferase [Holdemania massiliensis]|uniref:glycosyltransferase n=1 Tax=Holdemania massiliensis TaxID=1468449 RepID=UPI001F0658CE|nr:glycosyltransferase [Holdemania massiliensis]MCH1940968.1 glycosyltransferase [Holdemania massiliensis]